MFQKAGSKWWLQVLAYINISRIWKNCYNHHFLLVLLTNICFVLSHWICCMCCVCFFLFFSRAMRCKLNLLIVITYFVIVLMFVVVRMFLRACILLQNVKLLITGDFAVRSTTRRSSQICIRLFGAPRWRLIVINWKLYFACPVQFIVCMWFMCMFIRF